MTRYHTYKTCVEACLRCAAICNHCASSCTQEEDVKMMARCIQLDIECAAICYAAAQVMSLGSEKAKEFCRICADICEQCGNEWASIKRNIVRSVLKHVSNLQKSVVKWHRNLSLNAGESLHSFLI